MRVIIEIARIELLALEKLSLVSHALAQKLSGSSGREQLTLARTLDDVIRRIKLSAAVTPTPQSKEARDG